MRRTDWAIFVALMLMTMATLSFMPPEAAQTAQGGPALPGTVVATPRPSDAAVPAPTITPEPSATPTKRATLTPLPTFTASPTPTPTSSPTPTLTPFPFDTHSELPRYVFVNQESQHVYVFEQGTLVRDIPCSTGLPDPSKYTPAWTGVVGKYWGTFFAFEAYADEAWYLYKSDGSILIHSLPYTMQDGAKIYQDRDALGVRPASHGCIRISPEDAEWFTAWEPAGVPIDVTDPFLDKWRARLAEREVD